MFEAGNAGIENTVFREIEMRAIGRSDGMQATDRAGRRSRLVLERLEQRVLLDAAFGGQHLVSEAGESPVSVFAEDLDGDGDSDVLAASWDGNKVVWHENQGAGSFGPERVVSTQVPLAASVYAADLDADGRVDVLSASAADNRIAWYRNGGGGDFGPQQVISTAAEGARSVYARDLDEDGDLDVLSGSAGDDKVAWYENEGGGSFGPQQVITTGASGAQSVYATDLDGDGDADVLSASTQDDTVAWYENQGGGSFGVGQEITVSADRAWSVYATDLDGDGDQDVLSASTADDTVAWYENQGGGNFSSGVPISTTADGASDVYATDVDGDGDADVLSAAFEGDEVAWYENLGGGSFGPGKVITTDVLAPTSVCATDLDGDGDSDLLSTSFDDDRIAWYENLMDWQSPTSLNDRSVRENMPAGTVVGVFGSEPGALWEYELVGGPGSADNAQFAVSDPEWPGFEEHPRFCDPQGEGLVSSGDVDGDGAEDAIFSSPFEPSVLVLNEGNGDFVDSGESLPVAFQSALGDVDGDGLLDVVFAEDGPNSVYLNDGSGLRYSGQVLGNSLTYSVALGDIDHDGDLDLYAANDQPGGDRVYINDGTGHFTVTGQSLGQESSYEVMLAEFSGDVHLDAFVFGPEPELLVNDGTGEFTAMWNDLPGVLAPPAVADADEDGDLDLMLPTTGGVDVFLNDGAGHFSSHGGFGFYSTRAVLAGDLDGDGIVDALCVNGSGDPHRVFLGDGTGSFIDSGSALDGLDGEDGVLVDADSDGDLDVLVSTSGRDPAALWVNRLAEESGRLMTRAPLDYEAGAERSIRVRATAPNGSWSEQRYTIHVADDPVDGPWSGTGELSMGGMSNALAPMYAPSVGDLDGDGDVDIVGGGPLMFNNGDGTFTATEYIGPSGGRAIGDLNGDGHLDFLAVSLHTSPARAFINDGTGNFSSSTLAVGIEAFYDVALGDVDSDGDLDAFATSWRSGVPAQLWLNDGTGNFTDSGEEFPTDPARGAVLRDMTGDGLVDILMCGSGAAGDLWVNQGTDGFAPSGQSFSSMPAPAVADIDLDGDPDAVFGGRVFINDGTGMLSYNGSLTFAYDSALGDFNGDGLPDLYTVPAGGDPNHLWLNDGQGGFYDSGQELGAFSSRYVSLADFDVDGDLDAFVVNNEEDVVWLNHSAPSDFSLSDATVGENRPAGTVVGVLGPELGGAFGYELVAGEGDAYNSLFSVSASEWSGFHPGPDAGPDGPWPIDVWRVAAGDIDGDGDEDALFSSMHGNSPLMINEGEGVFSPSGQNLPSASDVSLADVNGDGYLDAAFARGGGNLVFLNDGTGILSDSGQRLGNFSTRSIAFGDLDGDGAPDLYAGNHGGGEDRIYINNGEGGFVDSGQALSEDLTFDVVLSDITGDGHLDAFLSGPDVRMLVNDGSGHLEDSGQSFPHYWAFPGVADVDADGDQDVLIPGSDGVLFFRNDGTGHLTEDGVFGSSFSKSVRPGDLNGDGHLDLLCLKPEGEPNVVLLGDGAGGFVDGGVALGTAAGVDGALADIDSDGDVDVIASYAGDEPAGLWINGLDQRWKLRTAAVLDHEAGAERSIRMRITHEGGDQAERQFTVHVADDAADGPWAGTARFRMGTTVETGPPQSRGPRVADIDADGDIDIVGGGAVLRNNGDATFTDTGQNIPVSPRAVGDLNGDGHVDILSVTSLNEPAHVLLNDGTGVFSDHPQELGHDFYDAVALGDVDADGDLDAVATSSAGHVPAQLWLNDGSGMFLVSDQSFPIDADYDVALEDMNGDGAPDLLISGPGESSDLRLNDGRGHFDSSGQTLPPLPGLETGDADLDGDPDVLVGGYFFTNDGSGTLTDQGEVLETSGTRLGDFNGDGLPDLYAAMDFGEPNQVWINDGEGGFYDGGERLGTSHSRNAVLADFDGDGDLDALAINENEDVLWLNNAVPAEFSPSDSTVRENMPAGTVVGIFGPQEGGPFDYELVAGEGDADNDLFSLPTDWTGFYDRPEYLEPSGNFRIGSGDMDGDGHEDLLFSNPHEHSTLLLGDGEGEFSDSGQFFPSANFASLGDVDADGDLDVVFARNGANRVFLNDGSGTLTDSGQELGSDSTHATGLGDLDSDGDLDLYAANGNVEHRVYVNDGAGNFAPSDLVPSDASGYEVLLRDFTGDGHLDALLAMPETQLLVNDGTGELSDSGQELPGSWSVPDVGDVDGDGDVDVVLSTDEGTELLVNDGEGDLSSGGTFGSVSHRALRLGDLDGDGNPDVFGVGMDGNPNTVLLGDGAGGFADAGLRLANPDGMKALLLDVDSDGDLDAVVTDAGEQPAALWINRLVEERGRLRAAAPLDHETGAERSIRVRISHPGGDRAEGQFTIHVADDPADGPWSGEGALYVGAVVDAGPGWMGAGHAVDIDADGDVDIVGRHVLRNDGAGEFTNTGQVIYSSGMAVGDLNGDGHPDVLAVTGNSDSASSYLNDGTGTFARRPLPVGTQPFFAVALGDVDEDGDLDAFATSGRDDVSMQLWLNDGTGLFSVSEQSFPVDPSYDVAIEDMTGDGRPDLLVSGRGEAADVWVNDGTGSFSPMGQSLPEAPNVTAGDIDLDGYMDAMFGGHILTNDGSGTLVATDVIPGARDVVPGDFNGDGLPDLYAAKAPAVPNEMWLNDGAGGFVESGLVMAENSSHEVALADFDGDGALDALVSNSSADFVWFNGHAPLVATPIPDQNTEEDDAFSFTFAGNVFDEQDPGDGLNYNVSLAGDAPVPEWLSFDGETRTFQGTPLNEDVGTFTVVVTATDSGGSSVSAEFDLSVTNTPDAPTVNNPLTDQSAAEHDLFEYTFPDDTFEDVDPGDELSYDAELDDGSTLPGWLSFDGASRTFSGTPLTGDGGSIDVKVIAEDLTGRSAADTFQISVEANDAPAVTSLSATPNPVTRPDALTLTATGVSDEDGTVERVEFYRDANGNSALDPDEDALLGSDAEGADGWDWTGSTDGWQPGSTSYFARAEDDDHAWSEAVSTTGEVLAAPTDISLDSTDVAENSPVGTAVGTFSTVDPDSVEPFTYSLVAGDGSADNGAFTVDGSVLTTAEVFDYETRDSYSIRVQTEDADGNTYEEQFGISVTDVAEGGAVDVGLQIVELDDTPGIGIGESFDLQVDFADVRDPDNPQAVFSGYADIEFDPQVLRVDGIVHDGDFQNAAGGTIDNTTGLVDEAGGTDGLDPVEDTRVFTLQMTAVGGGVATIEANAGEDAGSEIAVFGSDDDFRDDASYGSASVEVEAMELILQVRDADGNPLPDGATLQKGQEFRIYGLARDLRTTGEDVGVFSAYADVEYDTTLIDVTGITHHEDFSNSIDGTILEGEGLVDEVGGTDGLSQPDDREPQEVFYLSATAVEAGSLQVESNAGEDAGSENTLFGLDVDVREGTRWGIDQVEIVEFADLAVVETAVTPDHMLDGQTELSYRIENQGSGPSAAFAAEVVLSRDDVIGNGDDVVVSTLEVDGIAGGEAATGTVALDLDKETLNNWAQEDDPTGQGSGYVSANAEWIGLVVDPEDAIEEIDEANNISQAKGVGKDDVTYFPWDTNASGMVSPTDAIYVINRLGDAAPEFDGEADLDGNGVVTPTDAISVINRLGYEMNTDVVEVEPAVASTSEVLSEPNAAISRVPVTTGSDVDDAERAHQAELELRRGRPGGMGRIGVLDDGGIREGTDEPAAPADLVASDTADLLTVQWSEAGANDRDDPLDPAWGGSDMTGTGR